jgi:hypothetical protein
MVSGGADLGLADCACRLDVENDRGLQIDQIIVRIGEERVSFVSAGPLCCGIGLADELRHDLAGPTPKTLDQHIDSSKNFCNRSL